MFADVVTQLTTAWNDTLAILGVFGDLLCSEHGWIYAVFFAPMILSIIVGFKSFVFGRRCG